MKVYKEKREVKGITREIEGIKVEVNPLTIEEEIAYKDKIIDCGEKNKYRLMLTTISKYATIDGKKYSETELVSTFTDEFLAEVSNIIAEFLGDQEKK